MRTRADEKRSHTSNEPDKASQKLILKRKIYATINRQLIPPMIGTMVVASTATRVDCVHAIKNRDINMVDGSPTTNPPIFVPCFSASTVPVVIQKLPTINDRKSLSRKMLSMI
jgi:hypothetical protein